MLTEKKRVGLFTIIVVGLVVAFLVSSLSVAWATPSQDSLRQTIVTPLPSQATAIVVPEAPAKLEAPQLEVVVSIPAGAVTTGTQLLYTPIVTPSALPAPAAAGFTFVGKTFQLEAYQKAELKPGFTFARPVTISIAFTQADFDAVGRDTTKLAIQYYNSDLKMWISIPTSVDIASLTASAQITHLTVFALASVQPAPAPTPITPVTGDWSPGSWLLALLAVAGLTLLVSGGYYLRRV